VGGFCSEENGGGDGDENGLDESELASTYREWEKGRFGGDGISGVNCVDDEEEEDAARLLAVVFVLEVDDEPEEGEGVDKEEREGSLFGSGSKSASAAP